MLSLLHKFGVPAWCASMPPGPKCSRRQTEEASTHAHGFISPRDEACLFHHASQASCSQNRQDQCVGEPRQHTTRSRLDWSYSSRRLAAEVHPSPRRPRARPRRQKRQNLQRMLVMAVLPRKLAQRPRKLWTGSRACSGRRYRRSTSGQRCDALLLEVRAAMQFACWPTFCVHRVQSVGPFVAACAGLR